MSLHKQQKEPRLFSLFRSHVTFFLSRLTHVTDTCHRYLHTNMVYRSCIKLMRSFLYICVMRYLSDLKKTHKFKALAKSLSAVKRVWVYRAVALASRGEWHLSTRISNTHKHLHSVYTYRPYVQPTQTHSNCIMF